MLRHHRTSDGTLKPKDLQAALCTIVGSEAPRGRDWEDGARDEKVQALSRQEGPWEEQKMGAHCGKGTPLKV